MTLHHFLYHIGPALKSILGFYSSFQFVFYPSLHPLPHVKLPAVARALYVFELALDLFREVHPSVPHPFSLVTSLPYHHMMVPLE